MDKWDMIRENRIRDEYVGGSVSPGEDEGEYILEGGLVVLREEKIQKR